MEEKYKQKIIKEITTNKTICLLAPSFPVDFKYPDIVYKLRQIGFDKIFELTYAAKIINQHYHTIIKNENKKQFIAANCPCTITYIENQFPEFKKNIINIASPMVVMARFSKKKYPKKKCVFIGPCLAKQQEAKKNKEVDFAITFKNLYEIFKYFEKEKKFRKIKKSKKNLQFDSLYNDYTKIYPLSGAVAKTMHYKKILKKNQIIVADGVIKIKEALEKMKINKNIKFLDALFCKGGCIGGPGIISKNNLNTKIKKIKEYRKNAKKEKIGKHKGLFKYSKNLNVKRK
ncbi:MAG: [Fe-Fe] hydrogenase large subunit C-terminal domain-containing protein [Candidatus ainarchaeum sp.]|nr:[Fe-Fe] hydrogenase large subunit C-terminal domain-containing protein [Candidatus ainarchaeum sp.]MDD3975673.1 [Fe-Fe] hydrogenase large subunit C-terminal domain-containing protein [Candidatus ainarchaeum sp.]